MVNRNEVATKKGRIIYIEPTDFPEYKIRENGNISEGVILDNISWNQEDLQFNVDLRVINPDRRGSKLPIFQGKKNVSEANFASFMSGKDFDSDSNYLTDSYTDITFQEVNTNGESQKEALGIDSIDISFDSHFFPLVNIKFTDVRAAALFGPTDNEYVHNKRIDAIINDKSLSEDEKTKRISAETNKMSSSFFKSLFHFPYPRFMLSVMGYYGERVTFQLAVNDFKTSFNSTNGNFDVNVSFIGYMYGLYTDLPMSLIFTAPYYNSTYWKNSIENERFRYTDNQPIMTFLDYLQVYYELKKNNSEDGFDNSNILKIYKKLNDAKNSLEAISEAFEIFDAQFTKNTENVAVYYDKREENPKAFILTGTYDYELTKSKYDRLVDAVSTYNENYADDNNRISLKIFKDQGLDGENVQFKITDKNNVIPQVSNIPEVNKLIEILNNDKREIPGFKAIALNHNNEPMYSYIRGNFFTYYRGDFKNDIKQRLDLVSNELEIRQKETDEEMLKIVEKKLKFRPTVENVFRMIFAHIDTFINALKTNVLSNIETSIATGDGKRRADYLGLTEKNSDLPKNCTGEMTVPPFPLCKDDKTGNYEYPGVFFTGNGNNINYINEVDFIEKVVTGIKNFNKRADEIKALIESLSVKEDTSFNIITATDILYNDKNPYISLREMLNKVQSDKDVAAYIEYFIFARVIMYAINNGIRNNSLKNKISDIVNSEFINFQKAGISINRNTKSFLTNGKQYEIQNNNLTYSNNGQNKDNYLNFNSNLCYFFKNVFDKNDGDNRFSTYDDETFLVLGSEYEDTINKIEEKEKFINSEPSVKNRKDKFKDKDLMSYISLSGQNKEDIGFANDYDNNQENQEMYNMYVDFVRNGEIELNKYGAGVLQIGNKRTYYIDKNNKKNIYKSNKIDDIYLGVNLTESEKNVIGDVDRNKPVMSTQINPYFKAFLLLGSLSSYLSFNQAYGMPTLTNKGEIFKFSKVLYLYYGACIYFRRKENKKFDGDGINIDDSLSLINLPDYIVNKESDDDDIREITRENNYIVRTFTNNKSHLFLCEGNSEDCFSFSLTKSELKDVEDYFINWAQSEEFKQINETLSINANTRGCEIKNKNGKYSTYFNVRESTSSQDLIIKKLLCEDLCIYKRPNRDLDVVKEYSYSKEYIDTIKKTFENYKTEDDIKEEERKEEQKKIIDTSEIKKALYYTLKRLYDKWLSCYNLTKPEKVEDVFMLNQPSQDKLQRELRYTTNSDDNISTEFNSFIFVDSFYRDISDKFLINPDTIKDLAESYSNAEIMNSNASVFEFMNEVAEKNSLLFASLPVYSNFYDVNTIVNIFSPNKKYDVARSGKSDVPGNTYVIMYTGEASSKLDFGEESEYDDDGINIPDVFDSGKDKIPTSASDLEQILKEGESDEINFIMPVFGVTFGKQNQMYFKNITVNMDNPKVTDYSIANLIQISYGGAHGDSDGYDIGIGQDLYSIYANRSYTCTVEMLGCINIMPMMYFQLNNIPMFRGLYIIINVSHSITPGNMTTKFTGVRVSKNHIGLVKTTFAYQGQYDKINADGVSLNISNDTILVSCDEFIDERVGKHFMLSDFTIKSSTARDYNICNLPIEGEDWIDIKELKKRLNEVVETILDPLWDAWVKQGIENGFNLTSGFRSQRTTRKINEKPKSEKKGSAHTYGFAVDIQSKSENNRGAFKKFVYYWLKNNNKKIDQFIDEQSSGKYKTSAKVENGGWAHIGFKKNNGEQRGEFKWTKNASSSKPEYTKLTDSFYS